MTSKETDAVWRTRSEQPEALRLADEHAEDGWIACTRQWCDEAAAELRRLHKEVEWMKHNMSNVSRVEQSLIAANERLHAVNTELLEALQDLYAEQNAAPLWKRQEHWQASMAKASAAIARATGEQA